MKLPLFIFALALSVTVHAAPKGIVDGSCTLTTTATQESKTISFRALPGQKLELGLFAGGADVKPTPYNVWTVEIGNYQGTELQANHGGFFFSFARPIGTLIFRNPPVLCPWSPEWARLECEAENEANEPQLRASLVSFEATALLTGVSDMTFTDQWFRTVKDGFESKIQYNVEGDLDVSCEAKFKVI